MIIYPWSWKIVLEKREIEFDNPMCFVEDSFRKEKLSLIIPCAWKRVIGRIIQERS